jgi:SAM-dependent methyltransferase
VTVTRPCPACDTPPNGQVVVAREVMFGLDEKFNYACCPGCGSLYITTIPDDLADYYSTKYYSFDIDPEEAMGGRLAARAVATIGRSVLFGSGRLADALVRATGRRQVQTLATLFTSVRRAGIPQGRETRILDVGAGSGSLVFALGLAGLADVTGIDPFNAGDRTFSTAGRVLRRSLADVEGRFDLVMLHHSFEHVPDPAATLDEVAAVLAPGGRVLVRMPTVDSEAYAHYGTDWIQLDPPRHLTLFSRPGMAAVAERTGFRVVSTFDDSSSFQFWGSEQVRQGVAMTAENSHFMDTSRSGFTAAEVRAWERRSAELNDCSRGDQAGWVLERR